MDGVGVFNMACYIRLKEYNAFPKYPSETFMILGIPNSIMMTCNKLPTILTSRQRDDEGSDLLTDNMENDGRVFDGFKELDKEYVELYREGTGKKVWMVGPLSLVKVNSHDSSLDLSYTSNRGNNLEIDEESCTKWLDAHKPRSVVYVCFGSLSRLAKAQLVEIGLGLENSTHPFIWEVRQKDEETDAWLFEFEKKSRGLVIRGWAPQLLILSHSSLGGFLTHCGWNSTLEGITSGIPMITWPLFGDQFFNEKLVVEVLGIGVSIGVEQIQFLSKLIGNSVVIAAVERVMDEGEEGELRRRKAKDLSVMAKMAMEEGGSSDTNLTMLIQYAQK